MLKVDRVQSSTETLGPGRRAVVWFHGCTRGCKHCIASQMNASDECETIDACSLAERICNLPVEGVTLSGGEPFEQDPRDLLTFVRILKERSRLGVMVYTGYQFEELKDDARFSEVIGMIDLLVDGPYVYEQDGGELWRGSSNQKFHFLTNRYAYLSKQIENMKGRRIDVTFEKGLQFSFAGIPPKDFRKRLECKLRENEMSVIW